MKINLSYILSAVLAVALVAMVFTFFEVSQERTRLKSELRNRSSIIAEEFSRMHVVDTGEGHLKYQIRVSDSLSKHYNLIGSSIFYDNRFVSLNSSVKPYEQYSSNYAIQAINSHTVAFLSVKVKTYTNT
jgi:hypothetical protein